MGTMVCRMSSLDRKAICAALSPALKRWPLVVRHGADRGMRASAGYHQSVVRGGGGGDLDNTIVARENAARIDSL
jgi:hypothetical protein